jgi:hypothetical protein
VNLGAAAGASVAAGVAGAAPQDASSMEATARRLNMYSKRFFISFSFGLLVGSKGSTMHLLRITSSI